MDVVVDGVWYTPADLASVRVGVGITTHNRPDTFLKSLEAQRAHLPPGARLVVVDDASTKPVTEADYRFDKNAGIARAKNKCLELLDDCEHIFLFDDDAYPLCDEWWRPYVESSEPHLMRIFPDTATGAKLNDLSVVATDDQHVAYTGARGVMLYVHRPVLDIAGGMDEGFGQWGFEHPDWSNRIHAFGLTTWRYADVRNSDKLVYSMDEYREVSRSVGRSDREQLVAPNRTREHEQRNQAIRHEYRTRTNAIVTPLLTNQPDHKYKKRWTPSTDVLNDLRNSVKGHRLVVLNDGLDEANPPSGVELVKTPSHGLNPYLQRWVAAYRWLRDQKDIGFVWFVDGSDVQLLRDPFPHMKPGLVYVGSEPSTVDKPWMLEKHPNPFLQEFLKTYGDRQLLNAGLLGGDRGTILPFLHEMVRITWDNKSNLLRKNTKHDLGLGDMALLNYVAYTMFEDRLYYGSRVNTVFKANERNEWSWWKHK